MDHGVNTVLNRLQSNCTSHRAIFLGSANFVCCSHKNELSNSLLSATKMGDPMLAVGVLAAAAALVLGLRFSVVTLVLLTLATVINFATSVLGGSGPLVVGLQMLATLASVQISYLVGCLLAAHLPVRAELPLRPHANALRCIQATHFRKD